MSGCFIRRGRHACLAAVWVSIALVGCGGGGGSSSVSPAGELVQSSQLACTCTGPMGAEICTPATGASASACTPSGEKAWLRSYIDENYLFYQDVKALTDSNPALSPNTFAGPITGASGYFNTLTRKAVPTKDRFSFVMTTAEANSFLGGAAQAGYGIELSNASLAGFRVLYTTPGSPAAAAGVPRGARLEAINGQSFVTVLPGQDTRYPNGAILFASSAQVDALYAPALNAQLTLSYTAPGAISQTNVVLTASNVTPKPVLLTSVLNVAGGQKVGYIVFNDHMYSAQNAMADAFAQLKAAGVNDVVIDLRYNGGGYIFIAAQAAYMVAGTRIASPNTTTFEQLRYNIKRSVSNSNIPFVSSLVQFTDSPNPRNGESLTPYALNMLRVFVITTADTCSASESFINGLRGVDLEVVTIGSTTCGKPYGFSQQDNALLAYFPLEFEGVNAKGAGGFVNGFPATCSATDDLTKPLGDVNEGMLAAALSRRATGSCAAMAAMQKPSFSPQNGRLQRSPLQSIKLSGAGK